MEVCRQCRGDMIRTSRRFEDEPELFCGQCGLPAKADYVGGQDFVPRQPLSVTIPPVPYPSLVTSFVETNAPPDRPLVSQPREEETFTEIGGVPDVSEFNEINGVDEMQPVKRGRGRPRKDASEVDSVHY